MNAQTYLKNQFESCSDYQLTPADNELIKKEGIEEYIFKKLTSKKFRKYAAQEHLQKHIKEAIRKNVASNQPINITFLHGAYKLWRLPEAPEADWAELFAAMYFTKWLAPICAAYKPGVWFDNFVDDLIIHELNNISIDDVNLYILSYQKVLDFLKSYQSSNMKMTITPVGSQFESSQIFYNKLKKDIERYAESLENGLPEVNDKRAAMIELNRMPDENKDKDPNWREKNVLIHDAYIKFTKGETGYHVRPDKILAFTQPLPSGAALAIGTTKTSVAKFWTGVGALQKISDGYMQYILSPKQLSNTHITKEKIQIDGLSGKNFHTINIYHPTKA
jgi:hypothetical protein